MMRRGLRYDKKGTFMKKINYVSLCAIVVLVCTFIALFARVQSGSSERELDNKIIKNNFVVVMFYRKGKEEKSDKELRSKLERLDSTYDSLSAKTKYKDAGVAFVRMNIVKEELEEVARIYGVRELPAFIVFENGKQAVDNEGKPAILKGFATRADLTNFIETYIGEEIDAYLRDKEQERARRREEDAYYRATYAPYYYYPYYYGYPYYGYGYYPYYHRPGFGFGFHFGGGHHHRW